VDNELQEPPREGQEEVETLRLMMDHLGHDQELDAYRDALTKEVTDRLVRSDLDQISNQLEHLNDELGQPANYGNCLADAEANLKNYKAFETTAEVCNQSCTSTRIPFELCSFLTILINYP